MTTTPQEILERAAYIIETHGWTKAAFARDSNGASVDWSSEHACRFCAVGAIRLAARDIYLRSRNDLDIDCLTNQALVAMETVASYDVADWNDNIAPSGYYVVAKMREAAELID